MKILLNHYLLQDISKMMAAMPPSQRIPVPHKYPKFSAVGKPLTEPQTFYQC